MQMLTGATMPVTCTHTQHPQVLAGWGSSQGGAGPVRRCGSGIRTGQHRRTSRPHLLAQVIQHAARHGNQWLRRWLAATDERRSCRCHSTAAATDACCRWQTPAAAVRCRSVTGNWDNFTLPCRVQMGPEEPSLAEQGAGLTSCGEHSGL